MSSPNEKSALLLREDGPGGDPAGAAAATASANDAHRTTGTFRSVMALAAAALLVLACAAGVKYQYVSTLRQDDEIAADPMLEVYARTDAWNGRQTCSSCSVVLPSDTYAGRGLGPLIDQADCVVRFNAHHPNISGMSPEDYGSKDDIRVINGKEGRGALHTHTHAGAQHDEREPPNTRKRMLHFGHAGWLLSSRSHNILLYRRNSYEYVLLAEHELELQRNEDDMIRMITTQR